MFKSLKSKILVPSIAVLILLVAILVVYTAVSVNSFADEITQQRLDTAILTTNAYLDSIAERNRTTSLAVAQNPMVIEYIRNWNAGINPAENRLILLNYLNSIKPDLGIDTFVIVDQSATVMLRSHAPGTYNDSVYGAPLFMRGLSGEAIPSFTSNAAMPMAMSHLHPVWHDGEVIGTLSVNWVMHTNEFVDDFSRALNAEIAVFADDVRIATTILDDNSQREIGVHAPSQVSQIVLGEDRYFVGDVVLRDVPFSAYYFPLHGWDGEVIGMILAGFSNEQTIATTNTLQMTLIILSVAGLILSAGLIYFMIAKSLKPVGSLVATVKDVTAGRLNINMDKSNLPNDEIGGLTTDVYKLVDVVKNIVEDLTNFERVYNVNGEIDHRVDENKYENSFKDVAVGVNRLVDTIINDDVMGFLGTIDEINAGNFNPKIADLPGQKVILANSANRTITSLKAIKSEIDSLVEAAAIKGDLSFQIDESKYEGDWREIMAGLNKIATAVNSPITEIKDAMAKLSAGQFIGTEITGNYKGDFLEMSSAVSGMINNMSSYMQEIADVLNAVSSGDLSKSIQREYVGNFDDLKKPINNIVSTLHKTMSEISVAADQVLQGANQISSSALNLSSGAQEQSSSVQELNIAVDIINHQTRQNADNANMANELSGKSTTNAQEGNATMEQMVEAMSAIKESSNSIGAIVKVIQDIAFQTNLLALNASVEAARAGEHGKGFAVVANEVRTLAGRSQEAATQTTTLIQDSISRVETGVTIAESTAESLNAIVTSADEVLDIISSISTASKEQAEAIAQVSDGLAQISRVTQNNSAVSEETAAASEELNSQAETLHQLVSFFKL